MVTKEELDNYISAYSKGTPLISDEEYDRLLEEYLQYNGGEESRPFYRSKQTTGVNYLVGTLPKVYGVETPMREGQKTLDSWINTKHIDVNTKAYIQPKFDGVSIAYDCITKKYFTRGDYDNGESVDVTELFEPYNDFSSYNEKITALKFEAIMAHEIFEQLNLNKSYKRPRDVVSGIITSRNVQLAEYISLIPLRGYITEKGQMIPTGLKDMSLLTTISDYESINNFISNKLEDGAKVEVNNLHYSIDGVVASTIINDDIEHEVAIKILNNIQETKIINIDYSYGRTGKITPVGILEPVMFDNIKVDHVGLSTISRVNELSLNYNDTVRIVYNIVPYLLDSYHDGTIPIPTPVNCPICGSPLSFKTLKTVRCVNPSCPGLRIGIITRYCEKMKMMGLSKGILTKLFTNGLINNISDLYKLTPELIMSLEGFKEKSSNNICNTIHKSSANVDVTTWLGALPIKDISSKIWKMILVGKFGIDETISSNAVKHYITNGNLSEFINNILPNSQDEIYGISTNIISNITEGLYMYWDDIVETCKYVSFNILTKIPKESRGEIVMSGTRDPQLKQYLIDIGFTVSDNYNSKVIAVIIPSHDFKSSKVAKAIKHNIRVLTVNEAYDAFK